MCPWCENEEKKTRMLERYQKLSDTLNRHLSSRQNHQEECHPELGHGCYALVKLSATINKRFEKSTKPTPFSLDAEENPDPPSKYLQQLHQKYSSFKIVEMVQMRAEFEAPRAAKHQVHDNDAVIYLLCVEMAMAPQRPRVLWVVALSRG